MKKILSLLIVTLCALGYGAMAEADAQVPHQTLDTLYVEAAGRAVPGRYIWVPDSMARDVTDVLRGRSEIVEKIPAPEE